MKQSLLKCAAVVAGVIFGANGSFAANVWTYADGKITQGDWSIVATYDAGVAANAITLGAIESAAADGILNLRDVEIGGAAITEMTLPFSDSYVTAGPWAEAAVKEFYVNHVVGKKLGGLFSGSTGSEAIANATLEAVELQSDTIEEFASRCFVGNSSGKGPAILGHLVLDCPKLVRYTARSLLSYTVISNDARQVIMPWTQTIQDRTFNNGGMSYLTGELVLTNLQTTQCFDIIYGTACTNIYIKWKGTEFPKCGSSTAKKIVVDCPNVRTIGNSTLSYLNAIEMEGWELIPPWVQNWTGGAFRVVPVTGAFIQTNVVRMTANQGQGVFRHGTSLTSMEIGGPVTQMSCWNDSAVTNVILKVPNLTNTVETAFTIAENGRLTIYGRPWCENMMTNMLSRLAGLISKQPQKNLTIWCSKKQGWKELAKDYGDDFPKANAPAGCFGVWRETYGTGTRGAWMVHFPQPDDPQGFCIRVQ